MTEILGPGSWCWVDSCVVLAAVDREHYCLMSVCLHLTLTNIVMGAPDSVQ